MAEVFVGASYAQYHQFLKLGERLKALAHLFGKNVEPVHRKHDPYFLKLSPANQAAVVERLRIYEQIFEAVSQAGIENVSEKKLLWIALRLLKFIPRSDLMNYLSDDSLIEVYVGSTQVYRSLNYYDLCSYSFDELEAVPWTELFHRPDPGITEAIMGDALQAITTRNVVVSKTPAHMVCETSSPFLNKLKYQLKYVVPITDDEAGRNDCIIAIFSAELTETTPKDKRAERMSEYMQRRGLEC